MTAVLVDVGSSGSHGLTMSLDGDDPHDELGDENETTKRSERKRQREKQRRSDLSNAFDELSAFIVQVEPDSVDADPDTKKKRRKSGDGADESSGITRLDLIGRALRIMKRLHRENEQNKRIIASLREREIAGQHNDNVLVMLPTLTPAAEEQYPVARATYPSYPPHQPHHHHPSAAYYQTGHPGSHATQPPQPPPQIHEYSPGGMVPQSRHPQQYPPHSDWGRYGRPPQPQSHVYLGQPPPPPPHLDQRGPPGADGPGRGDLDRR